MSEVKPLQLSDDWDNNLYRNLVHVIATNENMIPGGVAEKLIPLIKAIYKPLLQQARLSTAREILGEIRAKYYAEMPYEHATVGLVHISKADFEQMEARYEEEK